MASTTSLSFPTMFDVARNTVSVVEDTKSVVNRTRLLILTEPTELYMNPDFGVGLRRHIWQYNVDNQKAIIKDRIIEQLRKHEPCVKPDETQIADGLLFTGGHDNNDIIQDYNRLKMTVALITVFGDNAEVTLNNE
nr:MAG TPA: baseplate wedge subunit [Caudoviricetes sp.]